MQVGRGVVLSFEDMTAVEESSQIRRDFVANVSHELRTPLTALLGFVETLKGAARDDPEARNRFLGIMEKEAGRMARLVDDLLWLSRVEQEERVRPRDMVDLSAILDRVVAALTPVADKAGVRLVVERPENLPEIPGDNRQLQQIITNLIENAVKYGGNDKQVEIGLSGPAEEPSLRTSGVRISVTDHGEGIAPHHIPRLTERFYRVDNHRSREMGGTGLGLAIVKHMVNRHRGRLRIDSELGVGSRFTVILPLE
jgi:two-component system phosphate regulon sensor histidine kinase PhoR